MTDIKSDKEALDAASALQSETLAALHRAQQSAAETRDVGVTTLEGLQEQRHAMERIQNEGDRLNNQLARAKRLQDRMGLWGLKFNGNNAQKRAKAEIMAEKEQERMSQERKTKMSSVRPTETTESSHAEPVITKSKDRKSNFRKSKLAHEPVAVETEKPGLLYGIEKNKSENAAELDHIATTDAEIDSQIDALGSQIDDILSLSKSLGSEVKTQDEGLNQISEQMEEMDYKQRVLNYRGTRFLTGKARKEYQTSDMNTKVGRAVNLARMSL